MKLSHIHLFMSCHFSNMSIDCPLDRMLNLNQVRALAVRAQAVRVTVNPVRIPVMRPRTGDPLRPPPPVQILMRKEVHIPSSRDVHVG